MPISTFVRKEIAEHGIAILGLVIAVLFALLVTLARYQNQEFSVSPLEVLSFSLKTFIPLAAFVLGNRLIVRDYRSRAQLFTESLPVRRVVPVIVKYLIGATIVVGLMLATLVIASRYASAIDSITPAYFALLALKTLSVALLFWSIAFAFSLSGHLRLLLYVLLIGLVYYLLSTSSVDVTDFGPFALLLDGTLAYERTEIPQRALLETWALSIGFTAVGFLIATWQEGSMAEVLSRPMARRDYLVIAFLVAGFITVMAILEDEPKPDPLSIGTRYRLDNNTHGVTVVYLEPSMEVHAKPLLDGMVNDLETLQTRIGPLLLRPAYVVHDDSLESWEFIADNADGPLVYGNLEAADHYDRVVFRTTVLHQLLLANSGGRSVFEHYHWFLDGYTRRITEASTAASTPIDRRDSHTELMARAVLAAKQIGANRDLIRRWQMIADQVGYASAEALAYSALVRLEEWRGAEVIDDLAKRWLAAASVRDTRSTIERWTRSAEQDFEAATGLSWQQFMGDWLSWLENEARSTAIRGKTKHIAYHAAQANIVNDATGNQWLLASFANASKNLPDISSFTPPKDSPEIISSTGTALNSSNTVCIMNYDRAGPFDTEMDFIFDEFKEVPCSGGPIIIHDYNFRGSGDRVYITMEVRNSAFHQPIRLGAARVTSP